MRANCRKGPIYIYIFIKKEGGELEITYSSLNRGGRKERKGLSLTTSCPTGTRSIGRRPRSSEFRLTGSGAHVRMGIGRSRRRAFQNYIAYGREATLKRWWT